MTRRNLAELVLLASIWGASFLLMRLGAVDFGPVALAFVRVAGASLLLLPMLAWRGQGGALRQHWRPIAVIGLVNSALPFVLFTVAALVLNAGLSAVFNATSPLWTAVVARLWLGERLTPMRWFGLALGFAGVLGLVAGKASLQPGEHGVSPALGIAACLALPPTTRARHSPACRRWRWPQAARPLPPCGFFRRQSGSGPQRILAPRPGRWLRRWRSSAPARPTCCTSG
jgi:drug/metabolite transporter (DMT)-like permease